MTAVPITVKFESSASNRFFLHRGRPVALDANGTGAFETDLGEWDLVLFGIRGAPGTKAKITLTAPPGKRLEIAGHPIEGRIAQGKTVWGSSRFFRVVDAA